MDKGQQIQTMLEQGLYHYGLGEIGVALDMWKQALELDPANEVVREYLSIELGPDWEERLNLKPRRENPIKISIPGPEKTDQPLRDEFKLGQQHLRAGRLDLALSLFMGLAASEPGEYLYHSYLELSKAGLFKQILGRIGSLGKVPELNLAGRKITELNLTEEEGFILSLINGEMSFEDILSLAPFPPFESIFILEKFCQSGLITVKAQG